MIPDKPTCSHLTRRGRPCRNPAVPGTHPPACATHRKITNYELRITNEERAAPAPDGGHLSRGPLSSDHFYLPGPAADDLRAFESAGGVADLQPEVDLVRVVLRRLLAYLDDSAEALSPEEARRIAGLLFTGARTVALLLGKRPARPAETQDWMAAALGEMGEEVGREL